jgi:ABC-type Na+ efflux pump permease subunit
VVISPGRRYHIPAMTTFLTILLVLAMLGVLGILGMGMVTMIRGGDPRRSNKLMQSRVAMQALAIVLLALLMMLVGHR